MRYVSQAGWEQTTQTAQAWLTQQKSSQNAKAACHRDSMAMVPVLNSSESLTWFTRHEII